MYIKCRIKKASCPGFYGHEGSPSSTKSVCISPLRNHGHERFSGLIHHAESNEIILVVENCFAVKSMLLSGSGGNRDRMSRELGDDGRGGGSGALRGELDRTADIRSEYRSPPLCDIRMRFQRIYQCKRARNRAQFWRVERHSGKRQIGLRTIERSRVEQRQLEPRSRRSNAVCL